MKTITTPELKQRLGQDLGLHVWNVTTDEYFKGEMIPGSRHIPVDKLGDALKNSSLAKDANIIVYCAGPKCPASKMAAEQMEKLGYSNVTKFEGGIEDWKKAGYDVESCAKGSCETSQNSCSTSDKKSACGSC